MAIITDEDLTFSGSTAVAQEYIAVAQSVRHARETVVGFAERHGAVGENIADIRTAVSEAATNVVVHAYDAEGTGRFRVLAVVGGGHLLVIIDDDGRGIDAPAHSPGLGLGRRIIEQSAEQALFLTRDGGGSTVQMRFRLNR